MTVSPLHRFLTTARSTISGDFSSTSRVVDTLLDLRQLAHDEPEMAALVDSIMAAIPGRSVVTNEWWAAKLDELEQEWGESAHSSTSVANS